MSVQIDMTNYEAFYLDYLEGNLSGEALAAFGAFLLAHPELSVDESPMITLEPMEETFDATSKLALKKGIDMNDLTEETIEFFLIAREEGLLNTEQQAQLNHWLEANAHYRQDAELYALVRLEADTSEVFANKKALKKQEGGRVIPIWWSGAAVAAGIALLVTIGIGTWNTSGTDHPTGLAHHPVHIPADSLKNDSADSTQSGPVNDQDQASNRKDRQAKSIRRGGQQQNDNKQTPPPKKRPGAYQQNHLMLHETVIASLEKRRAVITTGDKSVTPMPVVPKQQVVTPEEHASEDLAWVPVNEMKNPILPVTTKLSTTLNTPVDFRTAKAGKRRGGGFFLKIGKLEVSHQSGSQSASL